MPVIRTSAVAILLALGAAVAAQAKSHNSAFAAPTGVSHYEVISMGGRAGTAASRRVKAGGATTLAFQALGRQFDLELEPVDMPGRVIWVDDDGQVEEPLASAGTFVRGRVAGESGSWVRLRLDGGELTGVVATGDELYFLEPASRFLGATAAGKTVAYRQSDADGLPLGSCAAHDPSQPSFARNAGAGGRRGGAKRPRTPLLDLAEVGGLALVANKRAEISIIADFQYFTEHGANSAADITALMNAVDGIYQAELGVAMHIRNLVVYTSADPFSATTNYNTLLNEFSTFHFNNSSTPSQMLYGADLAHLITNRNLDGSVIGVAWLSGLCDRQWGSALSEDWPSSSFYTMTLLLSHEMGHNYGAPHDGSGDCAGIPATFIMNPSLSSGLSQQFSSCSKTKVADDIAAASCFDDFTPGPTSTPTITFTPTRTPTLTPTRTQTPTRTPTALPIGVPSITQPGANQTMSTGGITFAWTAVANALGYELVILNGQSQTVFSGSLVGNGATSTLIALPNNGSYTFRVRACTGAGCGAYASRAFTINLTTPSSAPSVTFPGVGATLTASVHNFTWTAISVAGDLPVFYELELIDLDEGDTELRITVPHPTLNTVVRLHSGAYRVRVRACQAGCGPWSAANDFDAAVPATPSSAPAVTDADLDGNLLSASWTTVVGAEWYQLYVIQPPPAGPGGGALTVAAREVVGTTAVVPIPLGAASVIVAACSGNGCGPFSGAAAITSAAPNPNQPNLGTPLGGSVVQGPTVLFTWNRIPGDNGSNTVYRLYVQDLSRGTVAFDVYTTSNFYGGYFKAEGARYDALVVANPGPSQILGPATGFIVAGQSSSAPTMTQPAHNSTVTAGNIQLGWSPVPGATLYEYFVAIPGSATPPTRGVTPGTLVQVPLSAAGGQPTLHSAIVRACPSGASCAAGSEAGWGPWSNQAGPGVTNFTVTP